MKNEFILLLIERPESDNDCQNAEAESVEKMVDVEHLAEKHAVSEHFDYRIKRVCHKDHFYPLYLNVERVKRINNRCHIKQKHTEYFVEIFNIPEENFEGGKNEADTYAEQKKNKDRNG